MLELLLLLLLDLLVMVLFFPSALLPVLLLSTRAGGCKDRPSARPSRQGQSVGATGAGLSVDGCNVRLAESVKGTELFQQMMLSEDLLLPVALFERLHQRRFIRPLAQRRGALCVEWSCCRSLFSSLRPCCHNHGQVTECSESLSRPPRHHWVFSHALPHSIQDCSLPHTAQQLPFLILPAQSQFPLGGPDKNSNCFFYSL